MKEKMKKKEEDESNFRSVGWSALCRSRRELSHEPLIAHFGFLPSMNESLKLGVGME